MTEIRVNKFGKGFSQATASLTTYYNAFEGSYPRTKASDPELWCFLDLPLNKRLSKPLRLVIWDAIVCNREHDLQNLLFQCAEPCIFTGIYSSVFWNMAIYWWKRKCLWKYLLRFLLSLLSWSLLVWWYFVAGSVLSSGTDFCVSMSGRFWC